MHHELENCTKEQLQLFARRPALGVEFESHEDFLQRRDGFHITPDRCLEVEIRYIHPEPIEVDGCNVIGTPYGVNVSITILYNGEARKHTVPRLDIDVAHALGNTYLPEGFQKCSETHRA